jgi:hypothetical protein
MNHGPVPIIVRPSAHKPPQNFSGTIIERLQPGDIVLVEYQWPGMTSIIWRAMILAIVPERLNSTESTAWLTFLREDGQIFRDYYLMAREVLFSRCS